MKKPSLIGLTLSVALALTPLALFAHARLQSSVPAADSQLTASPTSLTLNFSEKAQLAVLKLTLAGAAIPITVDRTAAASSSVVVSLPTLKPGKYDVQWSALAADDGHMTKGMFSFSITG